MGKSRLDERIGYYDYGIEYYSLGISSQPTALGFDPECLSFIEPNVTEGTNDVEHCDCHVPIRHPTGVDRIRQPSRLASIRGIQPLGIECCSACKGFCWYIVQSFPDPVRLANPTVQPVNVTHAHHPIPEKLSCVPSLPEGYLAFFIRHRSTYYSTVARDKILVCEQLYPTEAMESFIESEWMPNLDL